MSALSILGLVLPMPVAFILHDAEEVLLQRGWMLRNAALVKERMPWAAPVISRLLRLTTGAFAIAAIEELLLILAATACVLVQAGFALEVWAAMVMAFALHLLVHVAQAVLMRGYVPGLVTSVLLLPYSAWGVYSLWLAMGLGTLLLCTVAGVAVAAVNLRFAHWLGIALTSGRNAAKTGSL